MFHIFPKSRNAKKTRYLKGELNKPWQVMLRAIIKLIVWADILTGKCIPVRQLSFATKGKQRPHVHVNE